MRKPNYRFERAERDRNKQARKDEKLKRLQERVSQRDQTVSETAQADESPDRSTAD